MTVPATVRDVLWVEYQAPGGEWVRIDRFDAGSILRTRRAAFAPGVSVTARKFRLVARPGAVDLADAAFVVGRVAFWRESVMLSKFRRWAFDFDATDQRYQLIVTEGNAEVYQRGQRVTSVMAPYLQSQIPDVRRAQSRDTMLTFHPEIEPWRFARQGAHDEWDSRPQAFSNVPIFDYDGTRAGGVDEVQQLSFAEFAAGETFNLTLEGKTTGGIAYSTSMATLAAAVQTALTGLANVGAGGCVVTSPADKTLRIAFQGVNRADDLAEIVASVLISEKGIVRTSTVTQGEPGGEPVFSATRGWPAAGVFHEQRLILAAPRSRPETLIGSRQGFFFDLDIKGGQPDKGFMVDLATDQSTRLLALFSGPQLQVFSQSAEFFCATRPITTTPPDFPRTSSEGMEPGTPLFEMGGGTLFVQAGGDAVNRYIYSDAAQGPVVERLSAYAPHLTTGLVSGGFRRGRSTGEPNLALYIRNDGTAAALCALLDQEVLGWTPWITDGAFVEAGGELAGDLYVGTRRTADGIERHWLERVDEGRMLDASVLLSGVHERVFAPHLEGRTVVAYVDGADAGDVVVENGWAELPYPSLRSAEVGLLFVPRGRILPLVMAEDPRAGASMRARVGEIAFRLGPTANLRAGMTGKRMWPVALKRRGGEGSGAALLDHGPGEDAFEGWARLFPVPGFQQDAQIDWVQPRPGPLEIREVVVTVSS